ncbi:MAG: toll/interleukin-1 receptor domain-containing protein [Pedobacter sp.]|nr:toll/interleukin-1 receptor domain-containing protein [Chitinophagaceae bacterium]
MKFEKDIFISYAHIDDESLIEGQKGWVSEFHRALEIRLAQLLGRRPTIWRDPSLQGNHLFHEQIVDQFANVAIVISILTPRYVKSEWCVREVDEFYEACKQNIGFSINNKARIFKIIKTPVRADLHPPIIQNILGYEFYTTDAGTGRVKEFAQVFGQQTDMSYWEKLDDVANDICSFLESLDSSSSAPSNSVQTAAVTTSATVLSAKKTNHAKSIYLAESSYDTQEFRDSLKRELLDYGYQIVPDKQLPLIGPVLSGQLPNYFKDAHLAIHLIGENYGVIPEGAKKSIVEIQNDVATTFSASNNLQRLIWIPENVEPIDDRQSNFIDNLKAGKVGILGADLVQSSLEDFKGIMMDTLKSLEEKEKKLQHINTGLNAVVADVIGGTKMVYLICDMLDIDAIKPLEDYLFDNGYEVVIPIFDGDESQIREEHIENLKSCSACIIFFGNANELWLRGKMRDFTKISGYGRTKLLNIKAVYLAEPNSSSKARFRTLEVEVINGIDGLPEEKLKGLLQKI